MPSSADLIHLNGLIGHREKSIVVSFKDVVVLPGLKMVYIENTGLPPFSWKTTYTSEIGGWTRWSQGSLATPTILWNLVYWKNQYIENLKLQLEFHHNANKAHMNYTQLDGF